MYTLYQAKLLSISEAVGLVQPGDTIVSAMAASAPPGLLRELGHQRERLEGVTLVTCLTLEPYEWLADPEGRIQVRSLFYGPFDRQYQINGHVSYIPVSLRHFAQSWLSSHRPDFFWGTCTPPDRHGYVSLSLSAAYEKAMLKAARKVILEVNEHLPYTMGDTQVHIRAVDHFVEHHTKPFELSPPMPREVDLAIGKHVARLVPDGATLQLGIGTIPTAIAQALLSKNDLGIHTEMLNDAILELVQAGAVTGARKTLWPGKIVAAFALGSHQLYDFLDHNSCVEFQPASVVNAFEIVRQNHRMVSINTALQVDLTGQVCAESIGIRQFSGAGGQLDMHVGASMAPGGIGIIALRSTVKEGSVSTIVPQLPPGAYVTIPRHEVDTIVTEYGTARLKGLSTRERVDALISIAHPDFREALLEDAHRLELI